MQGLGGPVHLRWNRWNNIKGCCPDLGILPEISLTTIIDTDHVIQQMEAVRQQEMARSP
jgi:hypothetical protein